MAFPDTRLTLIGRLSTGGTEQDWQQFLRDYWGPICRFAARRAQLSAEDAEDVAAKTFEALLANRLLVRWQAHQGAKLRTLLCTVVRQVLANQARIQTGRARLLKEELARGGSPLQAYTSERVEEPLDTFYGAWVEDLLRSCVDGLLQEYHTAGKGDYFRVLYGRLCEGLSMAEISRALRIKLTDAENYFKAARNRLSQELRVALREHVARYCDAASVAAEFDEEWKRLGEFLEWHGGLEHAVESSFRQVGGVRFGCGSDSFLATRDQVSRALRPT